MRDDIVYDSETFPNIYTLGACRPSTGEYWLFEISERKDDRERLLAFLRSLYTSQTRMVGFNNVHFDYPILHTLIDFHHHFDATGLAYHLWGKATAIIEDDNQWAHTIWDSDCYIQQVDLFKIHHFDNKARGTSLKALEFAMRLDNIQDLPFEPGTYLTPTQMGVLIEYQANDIYATTQFYHETIPAIEFREELSEQYQRNFINANDTKIGKDIFIQKLEARQPGSCYERVDGQRQPRQTHRGMIPLNEVVLPYVKFQHPELQRIHQWFLSQHVADTNGVFKDVSCEVNGLTFDFGTGGVHASVERQTFVADPEYTILDVDVSSYYPSLAIANGLYPEHLGEAFVDIYREIKAQRGQYEKGTPINKALKLALNGVYGDSGNVYSPFYDLKYLLSITINGQLLLCMLAEWLMRIPGLQMIQVNTDGCTIFVPRDQLHLVDKVTVWWQRYTCLDLEQAEYSRMFVRDVNNYLAEYIDGTLKRKGAYEHAPPAERNPTGWHQDLSMQVVPKAAEAYLTRNVPIDSFVYHHADIMDFMCRARVKGKTRLEWHTPTGVKPMQKVTRYLVTKTGGALYRIDPPPAGYQVGQWKRANGVPDSVYRQVKRELQGRDGELDSIGLPWDERINTKNKSQYKERKTGIASGYLITPFNHINGPIDRSQINFQYYIDEARKLVI